MFHVWSQVSYKPVMAMHRISYLIVPVVIVAVGVVHTFNSGTAAVSAAVTVQGELPAVSAVSVLSFVGAVYFIVMMVRSYLLCFNVFYQMPKHMRRSTYQMLVALSAMVAARGIVIYFSLSANLSDVFIAISYIIMLYSLYSAFFIANSANVIVTSRDFVFSSLSTIVITVSLKGNILDWNKKSKDGCNPLPSPKYKEPYAHYRQRIMAACNGVVSPHDENILMTITDNVEHHFLFTLHDISFLGRKFGYLVEISEVTTSYAVLRYLEEIALYDNLTGLHNRNAYIETAKHIGIPGNMPLLILVGDINNLKKVNDSVGHLIGDKLLMTITSIVRECAPENAFVARIGGDEIVLLVPNSGAEIGNRFVEAVGKACVANEGPDIGIPSISWGYGVMQSVAENYNEVFRAADAVMYEAKRAAKREVSISGIVPTA
jgi:diguanylate cyclase (GGDEF)-like protein